jgi:hypothetical protein
MSYSFTNAKTDPTLGSFFTKLDIFADMTGADPNVTRDREIWDTAKT